MKKRLFLIGIISLAILVIDLVTKWIIHSNNIHFKLLPFFEIVNITNTGAAFGIMKNSTTPLIFISIMVIGLFLYYLDKIPQKFNIAMALIIGGALGNLIDRIFFGFVRDFIKISIWPVFNIADAAVTIGIIMWIIISIKKK